MNEWSSIRREPYSNPKVANFTYVGRAGGGAAITLNQGTQAAFYNTVVTRPAGGTGAALQCLSISDENTTGTFGSVFFSCPTPFADARAEAAFTSGTGNSVGTSTLANVFVNGANESAVAAFQGLTSAAISSSRLHRRRAQRRRHLVAGLDLRPDGRHVLLTD